MCCEGVAGNDLARVTGWGGGLSGAGDEATARRLIQQVLQSPVQRMDTWHVDITPLYKRCGPPPLHGRLQRAHAGCHVLAHCWTCDGDGCRPRRAIEHSAERRFMVNYMCVGVGARIALEFHRLRESHPSLFFHRLVNKVRVLRGTNAAGVLSVCGTCAHV